MRSLAAGGLTLASILGILLGGVHGEEVQWRPVAAGLLPPVAARPAQLDRPVSLGRPVAVNPVIASSGPSQAIADNRVIPASFAASQPVVRETVVRAQ